MSEYRCNYYTTINATDPDPEKKVADARKFIESFYRGSVNCVFEVDGDVVRAYPTDIRSCAILVTHEIQQAVEDENEKPDFPHPLMNLDTHYFVPKGWGVITKATAKGEPKFNPSEKYKLLTDSPVGG